MGSGVIYYEYEKREKLEDYDLKADAKLGRFKIRRYHLDDEDSVHPLHSVKIDPDCPYKIRFEALRVPKSWGLVPPSLGWMGEGHDKKGIGGMEPSIEKKDASEGDSEEEVLASSSLLVDIDAEERLPTLYQGVEASS
ncbi:hypothetical protein PIB30_060373 [Stylosanthes scabra]|uniref:Uncharacterized protein n=1 Tax=Stylosanthes scabra TaxID=79078 RepID=A0ABU6TL43_9FABA|nr:hypothetical protein [Stylosanthes scabra]